MTQSKRPQKRLTLPKDKPLREQLIAAFDEMIDYARGVSKTATESASVAVHEFRRSLRRAAAQVALSAPYLNDIQARWLQQAMQHARRKTGRLRDLEILETALGGLEVAAELGATLQAVGAVIADKHAALGDATRVQRILDDNRGWLAGLDAIYQAALGRQVEVGGLLEAASQSWERARRAFKRARKTRKLAHVHEWRLAAKHLRYQLELLVSGDVAGVEPLHAGFAQQARSLGRITDLKALREFIVKARKKLGEDAAAEALVSAIDAAATPLIDAAIETFEAAFATRPAALFRGSEAAEAPVTSGDAVAVRPGGRVGHQAQRPKRGELASGAE